MGFSNTFIAGFTFIYTLGTVGEAGFVQLNRQDLVGFSSETVLSYYTLLGYGGWINGSLGQPHPDYFTALLWKQLVGLKVLSSSYNSTDESIAMGWDSHIWCGVTPDSVVLTYFNMLSTNVTILFPATLNTSTRTEFFLTSTETVFNNKDTSTVPPNSLTNDAIFLNGNQLYTNEDGTLPQFPILGRKVTGSSVAVAPPWSYGFIVLDSASPLPGCI